MEPELSNHTPLSCETLVLDYASFAYGDLRCVVVHQLPNVPEDDTRMEVTLDVGLLEWDNLCAEQMFKLERDSVIPL